MFGIVGLLLRASALRLPHGPGHGIGNFVGVKNGHSVDVSRGTANGLDERSLASQKTLLVGVHDGYQRNFGKVQSLAKQVYPDEHIKKSGPKGIHDFDTFHGFYVAVDVAAAYSVPSEVLRQLLSHSLG